MNKCLYCYDSVEDNSSFHDKCALAFFGTLNVPKIYYSLSQMSNLAKDVVISRIAVPGVQPKLSMELTNAHSENRLTVVGALGGNYILKPPFTHFAVMPENEHLTMRIAEDFGIRVVPSTLIRLQSGEIAYLTKRIDRTESGDKIHMLDMFQITEAIDKYKSSYEKIGDAIHSYSSNTLLDKIFYLELVIFCFLTGNNDMHLKNFSLIESGNGWTFSPAYDLLNVSIVIPDDKDELALTLIGKKRKLKREHFEQLGIKIGLNNKQLKSIFIRMIKNKQKAINWIEKSFLSNAMKTAYIETLNSRYSQLNLI